MNTMVFPGTFDPVHNGHIDLIERGARIADRLIVAVAAGHHKSVLFDLDERIDMLRTMVADMESVEVAPMDGLLVEFAKDAGAIAVLRGLRSVDDFEFEAEMAFMNAAMEPSIDAVFLPARAEHARLGSTLVREIARLGGDISPFVPSAVAALVREKLGD